METKRKRKIEVFTAGCSVCSPVVDLVKSATCPDCEVIEYNLAKPCESQECIDKAKDYDIKTLPAIAVNGRLLSCCQNNGVSEAALRDAGIGQPV